MRCRAKGEDVGRSYIPQLCERMMHELRVAHILEKNMPEFQTHAILICGKITYKKCLAVLSNPLAVK